MQTTVNIDRPLVNILFAHLKNEKTGPQTYYRPDRWGSKGPLRPEFWRLEMTKKSLIHKFSTIMFMLESTLYKYMVWHTSVIGMRTFGCFLSDDCYLDEVSGVNKKWLAAVIWGHVTLVRPARPRAHMLLWLAWRGGEGGTKPLLLLLQSPEATPLARAQSTKTKDIHKIANRRKKKITAYGRCW